MYFVGHCILHYIHSSNLEPLPRLMKELKELFAHCIGNCVPQYKNESKKWISRVTSHDIRDRLAG